MTLLHRDVRRVAAALVTRLHIDPEQHYAGVFLDAAAHLTDARLWGLAALALAYSAVRWVEAYGLWFERRWGAWLGAASGAIYIPVEIFELWHRASVVKAATLALNTAVVLYLLWTLQRSQAADARAGPKVLQPALNASAGAAPSSSSSSPRKPPL